MREMNELNLQAQVLLDKAENIANMKSPPVEQYYSSQKQNVRRPLDSSSASR